MKLSFIGGLIPALVVAGSVAAETSPALPPPAMNSPDQHVLVAPFVHYPIDWDVIVHAFWEGVPAAVAAVIFALWITNRWDLAKKRNELDLELTREYYDAIGKFKSIGRQAELLRHARRRTNNPTLAAPQGLLDSASELEGRIDAILAKLILEDGSDKVLSSEERQRRRHLAGLLRVSVRTLREGLDGSAAAIAPSFNSPMFWLSNRIVSELGQILYGRALVARPRAAPPKQHPSDYLELINYRTADLHMAAAALAPKVAEFERARARARTTDRRANVTRLMEPGRWAEVTLLPGNNPRHATVPLGAKLAVEFAMTEITNAEAIAGAEELFAGVNNLDVYMILADREARVILIDRPFLAIVVSARAAGAASPQPPSFSPTDPLMKNGQPLDSPPWAAGAALPVLAAYLLRWELDCSARNALQEIADAPLTPG